MTDYANLKELASKGLATVRPRLQHDHLSCDLDWQIVEVCNQVLALLERIDYLHNRFYPPHCKTDEERQRYDAICDKIPSYEELESIAIKDPREVKIEALLARVEALERERDAIAVAIMGRANVVDLPDIARAVTVERGEAQQANAELTRRLEAMERLYRDEREAAWKPERAHERVWESEEEEENRERRNRARKTTYDAATNAAIEAAGK